MKKLNRILSAAALSVALSNAAFCNKQDQHDTFLPLTDFFDDFDRLFSSSFDAFDSMTRNASDFSAKSVEDTLQEMRKRSRQLHAIATDGLRRLHRASSEAFPSVLESTRAEMKATVDSCNALVDQMGKEVSQTKSFSSITVNEYETKDASAHGVRITLPGYSEKDINVTINKQDNKRGGINRTLEVVAQHEKTESQDQAKDSTKKVTQQMRSTTIINGRKRDIFTKDGVVTITVDLPSNVDEAQYKMTFENEILSVEFTKKNADAQRKSLSFSSTDKSQAK